jgi:predicted secreted Zn-dependent protease
LCRIAEVDIDYTLTYTMPKWASIDAAEPAFRQWWSRTMQPFGDMSKTRV